MIVMDVRDVLRDVLGSLRVQFLLLEEGCGSLEASMLDFQFRNRVYENFDYAAFAASVMERVPDEDVIDYKDDFGLHYLVFRGQYQETGSFYFVGPYLYRTYTEADFEGLLKSHALSEHAMEAIRWYFKRIPVAFDVISWRSLFSTLISRYMANPDVEIHFVQRNKPVLEKERSSVSLASVPYTYIEERYEVENQMLDAIRRGAISEAMYYQNMFMGFTIDQRIDDYLRNAKDMVISASTVMRKAVEQAEVHPLHIDCLSNQILRDIEEVENEVQLKALIPRMIRQYCRLVQTYSRERYSGVVRDVLNYVEFNYMEAMSLDSLAARYAVSKNYLSSRFHKEVGMTVTDHINHTRVQQSLKLLGGTTLSMPEIAERCGFADANYFSRIFKKLRNMTPNEYRKSLQNSKPVKTDT